MTLAEALDAASRDAIAITTLSLAPDYAATRDYVVETVLPLRPGESSEDRSERVILTVVFLGNIAAGFLSGVATATRQDREGLLQEYAIKLERIRPQD